MLRLKANYVYTKRRAYPAILEIKNLCEESNCFRNEHIIVFREYEIEDIDIDDWIIKFGRINEKNLQKNDRELSSQRMDLFLKKRLNKKLNDIYGENEAIFSVKGDDDESGYQSASNISIEWMPQFDNRRYWDLELYTRHLDKRLFSELDYTLLDSDGMPTHFNEKPPAELEDFCKKLCITLKKYKLR